RAQPPHSRRRIDNLKRVVRAARTLAPRNKAEYPELVVRLAFAIGASCCILAMGCDGDDSQPTAAGTTNDGGTTGGADGGPLFCPDPNDPRVHYQHADPNACAGVVLMCATPTQYGFDNACGCGCIDKGDPMCPSPDNPNVTWISHDPSHCPPDPPACPPN